MTRLKFFLLPIALLAASQPAHAQQWRERRYERPPLDVYWDGDCRIERRVNRYGEVVERRRCPEPEPRAEQTYEREPEPRRYSARDEVPDPPAYSVQRDDPAPTAPQPAPVGYAPLPARIIAQDRPIALPIQAKQRVPAAPPQPKTAAVVPVAKRAPPPPPVVAKVPVAPAAPKRVQVSKTVAPRALPKLAHKPTPRPAVVSVAPTAVPAKLARPVAAKAQLAAKATVKAVLPTKVARSPARPAPKLAKLAPPAPPRLVRTAAVAPARKAPAKPLIAAVPVKPPRVPVKPKPAQEPAELKADAEVAAASIAPKVEHVTKTKGNYPAPDWLVIVEPDVAKADNKAKALPESGKPVQASNRLSVKAERDLLLRDYEEYIWRESKNPYSNLK